MTPDAAEYAPARRVPWWAMPFSADTWRCAWGGRAAGGWMGG
jgi:hypothetical protein